MKKFILQLTTLLLFVHAAHTAFALERRKQQFHDNPAYLILPMPYSLPGLGEGLMVTGLAANVAGSYFDVYGIAITGDIQGTILGLMDIHLIPETLILEAYGNNINKAQVKNFENRGMNTGKDDFKYLEASLVQEGVVAATLTFFERRFELVGEFWENNYEISRVKNHEEEVEVEFDDPLVQKEKGSTASLVLDITDDRQDPWKGVRLQAAQHNSDRTDEKNADYYVVDLSAQVYIPLGENSTWAFRYMTSESFVRDEGETDPSEIIKELELDCTLYDTCTEAEKNLIDKYIIEREKGTATSLGGEDRLRSYPMGRFSGAHMAYFSTELRWNFATDVVPFDFWIWKDIATGFQLALFHEIGSVSEEKEDLGEETKTSTGAGLRMVSASGFVYRIDMATGEEGQETSITFMYPW